jgi:hypothetical protein
MKPQKLSSIFILMLVVAACEREININPSTGFTGDIFIEGILYPGEFPRVFISRSPGFFEPDATPQELFGRGAVVTITGSMGQEILAADSTFDKFRCRWVPFYAGNTPAIYGEAYDLTVIYQGKSYSASTTINQPKPIIDTVEYVGEFFDIYGGHDGVIITFTDSPGSGDFYRYQMNRMIDRNTHHVDVLEVIVNDCVAEGELFRVTDLGRSVFNDENVDGLKLQLFIEVAFEYVKGDSAWVFLQSLDKNAATFYRELDEQLLARYNPFVEPVFIKSKIGDAIGVFGSAVRSDSILLIYPVSAD